MIISQLELRGTCDVSSIASCSELKQHTFSRDLISSWSTVGLMPPGYLRHCKQWKRVEVNTWVRVYMNISSAVQLAAISRVSIAGRYKGEREKRYPIPTSNHVLFCLSYQYADNDVFDDFLTTLRRFPKIIQELCEIHSNGVSKHFRKINENDRRLPKTMKDDPKMVSNIINIFASEDITRESPKCFRTSFTKTLETEVVRSSEVILSWFFTL